MTFMVVMVFIAFTAPAGPPGGASDGAFLTTGAAGIFGALPPGGAAGAFLLPAAGAAAGFAAGGEGFALPRGVTPIAART